MFSIVASLSSIAKLRDDSALPRKLNENAVGRVAQDLYCRFTDTESVDAAFNDGPDGLHIFGSRCFAFGGNDVVNEVRTALEVQSQTESQERVVIAAIELEVDHAEIDAWDSDHDRGDDNERRYEYQTS